jgi:hypothetical protein
MQINFAPNSPPPTTIEIISCLLAVSLLGISYFFISSEAFQRSGALLVCIAILFGFVDFGKQIDNSIISTLKKVVENEKNESAAFFQKQLISQLKTQDINLMHETLNEDYLYQMFYQNLRNRIYKVEGVIAIVGTLVWAFGDLI